MTKFSISRQNPYIGIGTESGYRYPWYRGELVLVPKVVVPVRTHQRGIGTDTEPGGTGTEAFSNPIFVLLHC